MPVSATARLRTWLGLGLGSGLGSGLGLGLGLGLGSGLGLGLGLVRAEAFTRRDNAEVRVSSAQEMSAAGQPGSTHGSAGPSVHPRGASNNAGVLLLRRVLPRLCVISRECSDVVR